MPTNETNLSMSIAEREIQSANTGLIENILTLKKLMPLIYRPKTGVR